MLPCCQNMEDHLSMTQRLINESSIKFCPWCSEEINPMDGKLFIDKGDENEFCKLMYLAIDAVHQNAVKKGFWESDNIAEKLMLIVSEIGEANEALREYNKDSEKIPSFTNMEEELADTVIRIFDLCGRMGYRLPDAIIEKHNYNLTRPEKHGKAF